jgi:hypothetical protein
MLIAFAGGPVGFALFFTSFRRLSASQASTPRSVRLALAGAVSARGCFAPWRGLPSSATVAARWAVLDWNDPALNYRKLGAVPMDQWTVQRLTGGRCRILAG